LPDGFLKRKSAPVPKSNGYRGRCALAARGLFEEVIATQTPLELEPLPAS